MTLSLLFRSAAIAVAMLAPALAQEGAQGEEERRARAKAAAASQAADGERSARGEKGERGEKGAEGEEENLTPEQRMARNITSGASAYCRFQAALKPAKLLPGQSGMLYVTAILIGNAVLPDPAPFELLSGPQQGVVTLGGLAAQPAGIGRIEKGYLGRSVYENYAIFEMPVTMAATAPLGSKQMVNLDMKFDLYDGNSAQAIGRFLDRVAVEIEVGKALDPPVQGARGASAAATPTPAPAAALTAKASPPAARETPAVGGHVGEVAPPPTKAAPAAEPTPAATAPELPTDEGGFPVGLAVGAGGVVLLLLLLLARRG